MNSFKLRLRFFLSCNLNPLLLILVWLSGILLGIIIAYNNAHLFSGLDYIALFTIPSVFCLLVANLIPIILLYFFLKFSLCLLCYPLLFFNGVCIACCGIGLYYLFADSAWLIRIFLMFSNSIAAVFFWFLLFRNISGLRVYLQNDLYLSLVSISVISVVDFYLIAPFISEIYFIL